MIQKPSKNTPRPPPRLSVLRWKPRTCARASLTCREASPSWPRSCLLPAGALSISGCSHRSGLFSSCGGLRPSRLIINQRESKVNSLQDAFPRQASTEGTNQTGSPSLVLRNSINSTRKIKSTFSSTSLGQRIPDRNGLNAYKATEGAKHRCYKCLCDVQTCARVWREGIPWKSGGTAPEQTCKCRGYKPLLPIKRSRSPPRCAEV